ncbi:GmrSD restriction endonuclease domain-containing protein [Williamsia sp. SKLECPSW1]
MSRRRLGVLTGIGVVAVIALVGLIAPDDTKQSSDQAAAVTASSTRSDVVTPTPTTSTPPTSTATQEPAAATDALSTLDALPVKGRAPKTGYSRAQFGQAWSDDVDVALGHNGCDTRNDILRRDLTRITAKPGTRDCLVLTGSLADPYTGRTIAFTRGARTSEAVQIDHVVALSDAWQKGAQQLSADERRDLANDPRNLQATDGPTNQQKGDGDAATWLPPNRSYRCTYVTRQVEVKAAYRLWVTTAEKDAITGILRSCGGSTPPAPPASVVETTPPPRTTDVPLPLIPAPTAPDTATYYRNCAAARAAGAAPLRVGEPGYRAALDRDGDGVACE